jgi:hypothetical protein
MPKLTKRVVDAVETRAAEYFVWDSEIPGFGLRVLPSGRKGYVVQYRVGRRSRRISLGPSTVLSCEQARNRAMSAVALARNGEDPAALRDADRKAITVRVLAQRFDSEHIAVRLKASTASEYRRNLQRFILPALGPLTVTATTRADVAKFHHDLRPATPESQRSGWARACAIGTRMSGWPRCASVEPSAYSTSEWITLSGCSTTSI